MKKFLIIVVAILAMASAWAQDLPPIPEPEFIGEAYIVNLNTMQYNKLPKERGILRVANFVGVQTKKIVMKEKNSPFEVSDIATYSIIIKAENNLYDPISLFQIFRFEQNVDNQRVAELSRASSGTYYAEGNANNKKYVEFTAKKYGESSYILFFPVSVGNYGVITGDSDEESIIIATFDVFDSAKRQAEEDKRRIKEERKLAKKKKRDARKAKITNLN